MIFRKLSFEKRTTRIINYLFSRPPFIASSDFRIISHGSQFSPLDVRIKNVDKIVTSLLGGRYQRFGGTYCLHLQDWRWYHLQFHTALLPRRSTPTETTSVWKRSDKENTCTTKDGLRGQFWILTMNFVTSAFIRVSFMQWTQNCECQDTEEEKGKNIRKIKRNRWIR
jgi:hypothetical protein